MEACGGVAHACLTRRPDMAMKVDCRGEVDLLTSMYGMVKVVPSGLNVKVSNCIDAGGSGMGLRPLGGAPNVPHIKPEHAIVPSEW